MKYRKGHDRRRRRYEPGSIDRKRNAMPLRIQSGQPRHRFASGKSRGGGGRISTAAAGSDDDVEKLVGAFSQGRVHGAGRRRYAGVAFRLLLLFSPARRRHRKWRQRRMNFGLYGVFSGERRQKRRHESVWRKSMTRVLPLGPMMRRFGFRVKIVFEFMRIATMRMMMRVET